MFKQLGDADKESFRASWYVTRNFEYTETTRIVRKTHYSDTQEAGEMCNHRQLVSHFGGGDPYSKEGEIEALEYERFCESEPSLEMFVQHDVTKVKNYKLIRKLSNNGNRQDWVDEVRQSTTVNEWEETSIIETTRAWVQYEILPPPLV